jgi:hypothetical protein
MATRRALLIGRFSPRLHQAGAHRATKSDRGAGYLEQETEQAGLVPVGGASIGLVLRFGHDRDRTARQFRLAPSPKTRQPSFSS